MAAQGLRVLAFARSTPPDEVELLHHDQLHDLQFLGLQGMIDPPRPEAQRAIEACKAAGVRVKMITGDHAQTAAAIAQQLGIQDSARVHDWPRLLIRHLPRGHRSPPAKLAAMSDEQLTQHVEETSVFARVSPDQKLRLVEGGPGQQPHRGHDRRRRE